MLIAFSGFKGSGKDTAAKVLIDEYGFTKIAFADALRDALLALNPLVEIPYKNDKFTSFIATPLAEVIETHGWETAKRELPEVRRLMQVFGTEVGRMLFGADVWINMLTKNYKDIANKDARYVITDCRFDNEVEFVRDAFGEVYWIDRPGLVSDGHASESDAPRAKATSIFTNDSTVAELEEDVRFLMFMKGVDRIDRSN